MPYDYIIYEGISYGAIHQDMLDAIERLRKEKLENGLNLSHFTILVEELGEGRTAVHIEARAHFIFIRTEN